MTTHVVSYDIAINDAIAELKQVYPQLGSETAPIYKRAIRGYLESIAEAKLDGVLVEQNLSDAHKKKYQESFRITVTEDSLRLDFNPADPLIQAMEYGAEEKSMDEMLLSKNYKISRDGHRYKIIPLKSKDPVPNAVNFRVREVKAGLFKEEQFFESIIVIAKEKERELPFEITQQRGDLFDYRSVPMRVQITRRNSEGVDEIKWTNQRVYLSKSRSSTVNSVDRFTVFRTISDKPGAHKWRNHKGFPGLQLASYLSTMYHDLIKSYAKALTEGAVV